MSNQSTYQKHVTSAVVLTAAELIAATVAKVSGGDVSTINVEAGCQVTDPQIINNAVMKIQANLSHCVN